MRFADGVECRADTSGLRVSWGETLVADDQTRFLPFRDRIYVYSTVGGTIRRKLPPAWQGATLEARVPVPVADGWVSVPLEPRIPIILTSGAPG